MNQYGVLWSMYFTSVVSFQYHPGTKERLSLYDCARVADDMFDLFLIREKFYGMDRSSDRSSG